MTNLVKLNSDKKELLDILIDFIGDLDEDAKQTHVDHVMIVFTSAEETAFSIPLGHSPSKMIGALEIAKAYILESAVFGGDE